MPKWLVVDDEPSICWALTRLGESMGHEVTSVSSAEAALEAVRQLQPDVIVLDVRLPGMDGLTALGRLRDCCAGTPVVVITAFGDLDTAVQAVRRGAFEYLVKPFDLEQVERVLTRALTRRAPATAAPVSAPTAGLVGASPKMQEVFKRIALAAASEASVVLCGESGTGKELAARAIHQFSRRSQGPFVAVNVASLSPSLAESELFGHAKGSFTGAESQRDGLLVQADGGTLFLDEVADIPLPVQVKLLRVLEHGEVLPVGGNRPVATDFRVVSATHQDLPAKIEAGQFRHDLYFRLAAFRIDLPPLRQRQEDIIPLAEHFLNLTSTESVAVATLSAAACEELRRRPWYGNVRELRNAVEHAVIVARGGVIDVEQLPNPAATTWLTQQIAPPSLEASIADQVRRWSQSRLAAGEPAGDLYVRLLQMVEPPLFQAAMERYGQCVAAARALGLHRSTLRKKLDQYGLGDQDSPVGDELD
ncbi:MAG: sigma-54 dependent transcriptional regulator [Pirellulaceae bacterium]|nr:sigma-54 dependent transcriptional regulator [Pirellulaceae bacterium]